MASTSPSGPEGDDDDDATDPIGRDAEGAGDAATGGLGGSLARGEAGPYSDGKIEGEGDEADDDADIAAFFGEEPQNDSGLKLLARGDSLPLSYRSDNGTRESEFYLEPGEKENLNPYYDVVRRLSPTELIGRFMRTASPRVSCSVTVPSPGPH